MKIGVIISGVVIIAFAAFTFIKLKGNKEEMNRLTSLAETSIDEYPVRVVTTEESDFVMSQTLTGRLSASKEVMLTSALSGRIGRVLVNNGDKVVKGQVLMTLEDEMIQSEVSISKASYEKAANDLEKFKRLREGDAVTNQQLELLELNTKSARAQYDGAIKKLNETRIKSPIDGIVHQVMIDEGALAGPTVPVCEVVNIQELTLKLSGGEDVAAEVVAGDTVSISVPVRSLEDIPGIVTYVGVKPGFTGLFPIEIEVHNPEGLKAGYLAHVRFSRTFEKVVTIPESAISGDQISDEVFVVSDSTVGRKSIVTGPRSNGRVLITEGLEPGEVVVVEGVNRLASGAKVKIIQ